MLNTMSNNVKELRTSTITSQATNWLQQAQTYETLEQYQQAQALIDQALAVDQRNHLAWYEKSRLPIMQTDAVMISGRAVSLSRYLALDLSQQHDYLRQCGFPETQIADAQSRLLLPNLLVAQRVRFLRMAVQTAPDDQASQYQAELDALVAGGKTSRRRDTVVVVILGLIALVCATAAGLALLSGLLHGIGLLALALPYALSVAGMACYSAAHERLHSTTAGLVLNLLALLISNALAIGAIVTLISSR